MKFFGGGKSKSWAPHLLQPASPERSDAESEEEEEEEPEQKTAYQKLLSTLSQPANSGQSEEEESDDEEEEEDGPLDEGSLFIFRNNNKKCTFLCKDRCVDLSVTEG